MKTKILQLLGISVATNILALIFFFYYPYIMSIIYFSGGIINRIILPDRKLLVGALAGLPGLLLMSYFAWEGGPPFITANLL
ncbi:MAG TPA: hypothetical protein VEI96_09255, partial [Thermodesulfovibrionales bacterium]|nr:hypothetical protein [Thermodesulfovibrionales bacterium]